MSPACSASTWRRCCPAVRPGTTHREEVADLMIATVDALCAGLQSLGRGRARVLSPLDLERIFGLIGGDIFHGQLELDQLFSARPVLGHGDYRAPVRGLYMCGSGTHPGGGVTGAPGHNAARDPARSQAQIARLTGQVIWRVSLTGRPNSAGRPLRPLVRLAGSRAGFQWTTQ